ncbi:hypothetical protein [Bradyrhizobium sp. SSUT77]|nr:hypothetical protein [Bradyrhizobium sp. SSUT77]MDH2347266.1 hypothetical protein [Bradyrhizobium sp. SSUT77]MDH2353852.1 hypothetical protein [Bradyrhizobium sp. SSUT112]
MPPFSLRLAVPLAGGLALALIAGHSVAARTQISIEGRADAVRIDVADAPLRDVLDALQAKFALRYHSKGALDAARTLKLNAPLNRVVARLLDGYDFVIAVTPGGIDVLILQQNAGGAIVASRGVPAAAPVAAQGYRPERD